MAKRGRKPSEKPSKGAQRTKRWRDRLNNPIERGGPLTPCAASIAGVTFNVLIEKGYLTDAQAEDLSPEGRQVFNQAVSNYVYFCSLRDARELGL